jgi:hypothetical protein
MFGHPSDPSKIYAYGARFPFQGLDRVLDQMDKMHRYRNELVRAELDRRAGSEEVIRRLRPDLLRLETAAQTALAALEAARAAQKARNASASSTSGQGPADRARLRQLRQTAEASRRAFRDAPREAYADPEVKAELAAVSAEHKARCKRLRAGSGLYWCNYQVVEMAAASFGKGPPPRFHRRTGNDRVAVQIQHGMSVAEATSGDDLRFRLVDTGRRACHGAPIYQAWLRIGSDNKSRPIWAVCTCEVHRLPPDDAAIKWVYLRRRRRGVQHDWKMSMVVSRKEGWPSDDDEDDDAVVAVNPGWRVVPGGLRVATWVGLDDDDRQGMLVLGQDHLRLWERASAVRGERDDLLTEATRRLSVFVTARQTQGPPLPGWIAGWRGLATVRRWRSQARLAALVLHWRHNRFQGDEDVYGWLEGQKLPHPPGSAPAYRGWRVRDAEMANLEACLLKRAINKRENAVRALAALLSQDYRTVVLAKVDYRKLARKLEVEEAGKDGSDNETARRNRHISAPGRTSELFREKFSERVVVVDAAYMTQRCCVCARMDAFDAAAEVVRTCRHCRATIDQDVRHCLNLLSALRDRGLPPPQGNPPRPG